MAKGKAIGTLTDEEFDELKGLSLGGDRLRERVDVLMDRIFERLSVQKEDGKKYYVDRFSRELTVRDD